METSTDSISYEDVVKRIDKNKGGRILFLITVVAALGGFLFGYDNGIIGSAILYLCITL